MKEIVGRLFHKKTKFPTQTVDVNTTSDFGFLQPMCGCFPLVPNSTLRVNHRSFVRFHQMPFPTFGRVEQKTYHYFVPVADIYHAFESMLAKRPYRGAGSMYTPLGVPFINANQLSIILLCYTRISIYKVAMNGQRAYSQLAYTSTSDIQSDMLSNLRSKFLGSSAASAAFDSHFASHATFDGSVANALSADYSLLFNSGSDTYVAHFEFTNHGKNIRKVLIGLGYQFTDIAKEVTILPIIAYLKIFFDYWYPKRDITWKQTAPFSLMEKIEQYNLNDDHLFLDHYSFGTTDIVPGFYETIDLLKDCYYYQNPDYYTAQTGTTSLAPAMNIQTTTVNGGMSNLGIVGSRSDNNQAQLRWSDGGLQHAVQVGNIGWAQLKALQFLSKHINKYTAIGGKIDDYLRATYGSDYLQRDNSYFIGCDVNQIEISDVMSTADTINGASGSGLGEYAGKGIGYSEGKSFKFSTDNFGYYINMTVVVPLTRYNQGIDPCLSHINRFDFYTPEADGLTLLPTSKTNLFVPRPTGLLAQRVDDAGFGYQPIYSEYKMRPLNISNGDFSRNNRQQYKGFYLDRIFNQNEIIVSGTTPSVLYVQALDGNSIFNELSPSTELRTIGKYGDYENYNRIFVNDTNPDDRRITEDNIISHNVFEYDIVAPMLPYSESFDTDAFANGLSVEKA